MTEAASVPAIRLIGASKSYRKGGEVLDAVSDITLEVGERGMVAVVGALPAKWRRCAKAISPRPRAP